jgi:hypothetical protein
VSVAVGDFGGANTIVNSTANVADAPLTVEATPSAFSVEGSTFSGQVATFKDADPGGVASDYVAQIDWGDGTTTAFGSSTTTIVPAGSGFAVIGAHQYAEEGTYPIKLTIVDTDGGSPSAPGRSAVSANPSMTINVLDAPLTAAGAAAFSGIEGAPTGSVTVASFTDADPGGVASDYVATINWGDGQTSPASISASGNGFLVRGSHIYAEEGTFTASAVITDTDGGPVGPGRVTTTSPGTPVTVADAPLTVAAPVPTISAVEGQALAGLVVANFNDGDPGGGASDFVATINWGDGTATPGLVFRPGVPGSPFEVLGSHAYSEEGTYLILTSIVDTDGRIASTVTRSSVAIPESVSVADAALSASATPLTINATEGVTSSNLVTATFTDADPGGTASDYSASIDWGDGSTSSGLVSAVSGTTSTFNVVGSHAYAEAGTYPVKVTIVDTDGGSIAAPGRSVVVASNALAVVADAQLTSLTPTLTLNAIEGEMSSSVLTAIFSDADPAGVPSDYRATIDWGDGRTSTGNVQPGVGVFNITGSHTYAEEGSYAVKVTIADTDGTATAGSTIVATGISIRVADAPLLPVATPSTIQATAGTTMGNVVVGSFTDTDPGGVANDYTASINWGDLTGATSASGLSRLAGSTFNVLGVHTYEVPGSYTITVTVNDTDGGTTVGASTTVSSTTVVVVGTPSTASSEIHSAAIGISSIPAVNAPDRVTSAATPGVVTATLPDVVAWTSPSPGTGAKVIARSVSIRIGPTPVGPSKHFQTRKHPHQRTLDPIPLRLWRRSNPMHRPSPAAPKFRRRPN